jgi:hypothetical protein
MTDWRKRILLTITFISHPLSLHFAHRDHLEGAAYMNVIAMYVIRELRPLSMTATRDASTADCNDDAVHALDEAMPLQWGTHRDSIGELMYALAEKRCIDFNTCGKDGGPHLQGKRRSIEHLLILKGCKQI